MDTLETMMQRIKSRRLKKVVEKKQISRELIYTAVINAIQPFYSGQEIKGIDIPALTTKLIDIEIHKEV
jgi:hypothetical protein